jgi:hypothetical protein
MMAGTSSASKDYSPHQAPPAAAPGRRDRENTAPSDRRSQTLALAATITTRTRRRNADDALPADWGGVPEPGLYRPRHRPAAHPAAAWQAQAADPIAPQPLRDRAAALAGRTRAIIDRHEDSQNTPEAEGAA